MSPPKPTQAKKMMNPTTSQFERRRLASCCAKRLASSLTRGLLSERSTFGTARSAASSISHSSAGWAFASPATSSVGKVACFVLYWVATSL